MPFNERIKMKAYILLMYLNNGFTTAKAYEMEKYIHDYALYINKCDKEIMSTRKKDK